MTSNLVTLCVSTSDQAFLTDFTSSLQALGYTTKQHRMPTEIELSCPEDVADAFVLIYAEPDDTLWAGAESLRNACPASPLLLIAAWVDTPEIMELIDAILPAQPGLAAHQLDRFIRLRHSLVTLQDENASLQEQLAEQQRSSDRVEVLKNAIVRNVSHELRTPLLQVKSAVSMLAEDKDENDLVMFAKNATARLEGVVKNITMLGSSLETNLGPVILRETIEYARRNLARSWKQHDAQERVRLELEEGLPPVTADKMALGTVIQLLLDNGLKFSQHPVTLRARREDSEVVISIEDHGIGITDDHIKQIFEPFYQADSSITRRFGGTGVGLSIVRIILDQHQAPIEVNSTPQKGTVFSFRLPVVEL